MHVQDLILVQSILQQWKNIHNVHITEQKLISNQAVRLWMNGKGTGTVQKRCLSFLQTEEKNHGKNYCHYAIFGVLLKKVIYYKEEEHV